MRFTILRKITNDKLNTQTINIFLQNKKYNTATLQNQSIRLFTITKIASTLKRKMNDNTRQPIHKMQKKMIQ